MKNSSPINKFSNFLCILVRDHNKGYDIKGAALTEIRFNSGSRESAYIDFRYRIVNGKPEMEYLKPLITKSNNNIEVMTEFSACYRDGKFEVTPGAFTENGRREFEEAIIALMSECQMRIDK